MNITALRDVSFREMLDSNGGAAVKASVQTIAGQKAFAVVSCAELSNTRIDEAVAFGNDKATRALRGIDAIEQAEVDRKIRFLEKSFSTTAEWRPLARALSMAVARVGARAAGRELRQHLRYFAPFSGPGWPTPVPLFEMFSSADGDIPSVSIIINPRASKGPRRSLATLIALAKKITSSFKKQPLAMRSGKKNEGTVFDATSLEHILEAATASARHAGLRGSDFRFAIDFDRLSPDSISREEQTRLDSERIDEAMLQLCHTLIARYPVGMIENAFRSGEIWRRAQRHFSDRVTFLRHDLAEEDTLALQQAVLNEEAATAAIDLTHFTTITDALDYAVEARGMNLPRVVLIARTEAIDDFLVDFSLAIGAEYLKLGSFSRAEHIVRHNRLLDFDHEQNVV